MLLPCAGALAAGPANVRLRVEGTSATLVERTALRTDTHVVNKDGTVGHDCTGTSAAGALDIATKGNWTGSFFAGLGYSVERILGETHAFPDLCEAQWLALVFRRAHCGRLHPGNSGGSAPDSHRLPLHHRPMTASV